MGRIAGCCALLLAGAGIVVSAQAPGAGQPSSSQAIVITLDEAIHRAQANEPTYVSAAAGSRIAGLDRSIARSSLLPNAVYLNGYLFTQGNGLPAAGSSVEQPPRFIANNAVREFVSQASVTETLGLGGLAGVRRADAAAAMAAAELEVARRGLVVAVIAVLLFDALSALERRLSRRTGRARAA